MLKQITPSLCKQSQQHGYNMTVINMMNRKKIVLNSYKHDKQKGIVLNSYKHDKQKGIVLITYRHYKQKVIVFNIYRYDNMKLIVFTIRPNVKLFTR